MAFKANFLQNPIKSAANAKLFFEGAQLPTSKQGSPIDPNRIRLVIKQYCNAIIEGLNHESSLNVAISVPGIGRPIVKYLITEFLSTGFVPKVFSVQFCLMSLMNKTNK